MRCIHHDATPGPGEEKPVRDVILKERFLRLKNLNRADLRWLVGFYLVVEILHPR